MSGGEANAGTTPAPSATGPRLWWLVGLVTLARVIYLAMWCPYPLIEDEAQYWEWSRRPDWSYYSKGPGIAWTIGAATSALGDTPFAVRFPAALWGGALALAIGLLAQDMVRDRKVGVFAAAVVLLIPAFQGTAMLMTIDGPYIACWALACLAFWRAVMRASVGAWVACGLAIAVGFLYKYTILALPVGLLGYCIANRRHLVLHRWWRACAVLGFLVAALGLLPVLVWNGQNGWPTIKHLLGHLGVAGGDMPVTQGNQGWHYDPKWTLEFLGTQIGLIGPALLLMIRGTRRALVLRDDHSRAYLAGAFACWVSAPLLIGYLLVTFVAEAEGNWTLAAYAVPACLAGWAASRLVARRASLGEMDVGASAARQSGSLAWRLTLIIGLISGLGMLRLDWFASLADTVPRFRERRPMSRMLGVPEAVAQIAELREEVRAREGREPMIIGAHYGIASQLAFGLPDHPVVYVAGSYLGGRKCQHDYWPECDLKSESFFGRTAIIVAERIEQVSPAFERVQSRGALAGFGGRKGEVFIGEGYRGFPVPEFHP